MTKTSNPVMRIGEQESNTLMWNNSPLAIIESFFQASTQKKKDI